MIPPQKIVKQLTIFSRNIAKMVRSVLNGLNKIIYTRLNWEENVKNICKLSSTIVTKFESG